MLRAVLPLRPSRVGIELEAQEVPDVAKNAIPDGTEQFPLRVGHPDLRTQGNRLLDLEARPGLRNILEISHYPASSTRSILPAEIHDIRAQHPRFHPPVLHTSQVSAGGIVRISAECQGK